MISRGIYIGEIIDSFSEIENQVKLRCQLNLTDLNIHLESFFKDILNITHGLRLKNLNDDRSNNPGLDLGDKGNSIALQVTSSADARKINDTLEAIIKAKQHKTYKKIRVLIIGKKQSTYRLKEIKDKHLEFNPKTDIWDFSDLLRVVLGLESGKLKELHDLVKSELLRIKTELDISFKDQKAIRRLNEFIETRPEGKVGSGEEFFEFVRKSVVNNRTGWESPEVKQLFLEYHTNDTHTLSKKLSKLPKLSREFYCCLLSRSREGFSTITIDYVSKVFNKNYDWLGDVRELELNEFVKRDINEIQIGEEQYDSNEIIKIKHPPGNSHLLESIYDFDDFYADFDSSQWFFNLIQFGIEENALEDFMCDLNFTRT